MRIQEQINLDEQNNGEHNGGGIVTHNRRFEYPLGIWGIFTIVAVFVFSITFAALLTYNFGICSNINVQSEVCDKKNVIPITIALNNSTIEPKDSAELDDGMHPANRTNVRLPKSVHPILYEIKLTPYLWGNFTFEGDVRIQVNVTTNCKNITLHAIGLKFFEVNVWKIKNANQTKNHTQIEIDQQKIMPADQLFVMIFSTELDANAIYEVNIKYNGTLNENLQGFYRSSYEVDNTTR